MIDPDSIRQTKGISILLVDDHPVVRQGISRILAAEIADLSLGEAVDGLRDDAP